MIDFYIGVLLHFGARIVEGILWIAFILTGETGAPGLVSLALILILVSLIVWYAISTCRFRGAVKDAQSIIGSKKGQHITSKHLIQIDREFRERRIENLDWKALATAWDEFKETTVPPESETDSLRNTVRPNVFFNREELGLESGIWRQVPALFVSVGLFLTFLGLVAALHETGNMIKPEGGGDTVKGLETLLNIASAKFIMSLTGLMCSIVFTLVLRFATIQTDKALLSLCVDIENGCDFMSEQDLLRQMHDQAEEQTGHLKLLGTELVAQIAKPLREELPETIRKSIEQAMEPAMEKISKSTGQSMESLAGTVGSQITEGVNDSVRAMNEAIGNVSQNFEVAAGRLDKTVDSIGGHIDEALQSIRMTSSDGAKQIADASRAMAETTEMLAQTVQETMRSSAEASAREIESAGQGIASEIRGVASAMHESIVTPMDELVQQLKGLVSQVELATGQVGQYADSVDGSAAAIKLANRELSKSADSLASVALPVRDAVQKMGDQVEEVSKAMLSGTRQTTEHMTAILGAARESIEASQTTVREGLGALESVVKEFRQILGRYGEIDRSLGGVFEKIEDTVQKNIEEFSVFQRKLNEELGDALNRLQTVIAQAEPFAPRRNE